MKQFAKLNPLVKDPGAVKTPKDFKLEEAAKSLVKGLETAREKGNFEIHVTDESESTPVRLDLTGDKPALAKSATGKADFAIKGSRATLAEIAKGDLSPVDAYLAGQLEVHGDLDFGKRLFARLAAKAGEKEF
jgi:putative sterol carrier protein